MSSEPSSLIWIALFIISAVGVVVILLKRSSKTTEADPIHHPSIEEPETGDECLRLARAAHARGDFQEATEHYRAFAGIDQNNRLPWVEIAKIQHDNLEDPESAIETLKNALEGQDWPINDAAYFMTRSAEIHWHDLGDLRTSASILNQVIECFPDTRHAANAVHLLREMNAVDRDVGGESADAERETGEVPEESDDVDDSELTE